MLPGRKLTIDFALKVLLRRGWILIGPLVVGAIGGLVYSRSLSTLYRSDATVQVIPQRIPETYVQSTVTARVQDRLSSIEQQVLSRTQLEAVIREFSLYPAERRVRPMEDVVALMKSRVAVAPMEGTTGPPGAVDAFRISFDYDNPRVARDVVARLAGFFVDRNARERGAQADQASSFLETQLADARTRLEAQERTLAAFRERNSGRLPTQMQANMQAIQNSQMALQSIVESLARDKDRRQTLELLYRDASADPLPTVPASAVAPAGDPTQAVPQGTARQRLEAARSALDRLQLRLSAKHPDVERAKRLVEDLERQVPVEGSQQPGVPTEVRAATPEEIRRREKLREMRAEIDSLDRQIAFKEKEQQRLQGQIDTYQARLEAVPGVESEWVKLNRDHDTLQKSYEELLSKSENSKMAASLEQRQIGEQFRILDAPQVPLKPHSPMRIRINAMATLAGLAVGVLLIALLEYLDSTMRTEADVIGAIDLPILVLVPLVSTPADEQRRAHRRLLLSAGGVALSAVTVALFWSLQLWKYVI